MTGHRQLTSLYETLLRLYPTAYREAWGARMAATFDARLAEPRHAGVWRRSRFAGKELGNLLFTAARERFGAAGAQPRPEPAYRGESLNPGPPQRPPRSPRRDIVSHTLFDLRVALRSWRREPLATVVILLTLALGIGATTAIFSVVDGVMLRPLPLPAADRLVRIHETLEDGDTWTLSMPDFVDIRAQAEALDGVSVYDGTSLTLSGTGDPERVDGMRVSAGFFEMLGTQMPLGRSFTAADEAENAPATVILGYDFWRARFDTDADVLGRDLRIEGTPHTIIGVAPDGIDLGDGEPQLWVPFAITEGGLNNRGGHMYPVMGRVATQRSLDAAAGEVAAIMERIATENPDSHEGRGMLLRPLQEEIVGDVDTSLLVLLAAVGMLLLIACANVASIMLAQSDARGQEVALRAALGAGTGRLVRQLLAESTTLTLLGGIIGIVLAHFGVSTILERGVAELPRAAAVHTDWRVVAFGLLVSFATGIGVGLVPALRAVRGDLHAPLKDASRSQAGGSRLGLQRALVITEMALAVMLVLGAGLLVQSLVKLQGVDKGFDADDVLSFRIALPTSRYPTTESWAAFTTRFRSELQQLPGVEATGAVGLLPFFASQTTDLQLAGDPEAVIDRVQFRYATPGFFEAIGTRVVRGRAFDEGDVAGAAPAMILNETAARRLFGGEDPIGRQVSTGWGHHPDAIEVVGVVEDVRLTGPQSAPPAAMYWPFGQYDGRSSMSYVVRTAGNPSGLVPAIRNLVSGLDPELPIYSVELLADRTRRSVAQERLVTGLLTGFAALALLLAAIGIFGVMAYSVVRRRREIGVRVAIGAGPNAVVRTILLEGFALAGIGVLLGAGGALALGRAFGYLLYETSPADPMTFAGVSALLLAVAMLACLLPARRAARIDPMVVLRND